MFYRSQKLKEELVSGGYTGNVTSALKRFLADEGYTGSVNKALNQWLGSEGYNGHFCWKQLMWAIDGFPLSSGGAGAYSSAFSSAFDI